RTQHADLPHYALLHRFATRVMRLSRAEPADPGRSVRNVVLVEQSQRAVQPLPTPPLPPETMALARSSQVVPNLLFHPVADEGEAATRMTDRKVLHPAAQDRIDTRNHLCDRPRPMTSEHLLECVQQRRPLLATRCQQRHPSASPTANPTELEAEK